MSALETVYCVGAPRDLGLDQGRAFAERIRREASRLRPDGAFARWFFERSRSGRAAAVRRDTLRYFPHLGERTMGLARGSGVGEMALAGLLGRAFDGGGAAAIALSAEATGGAPLIIRIPSERESAPIIRESVPDSDYASADLALPWRVAALGGVNEHGLAVASVSLGSPARERAGGHAAPALLLTQDCLQRFDLVEKAVDWLSSRPAGGAASFVLADATGAVRGVEIEPAGRVTREAEGALLVAADAGRRGELGALFEPGERYGAEEVGRLIDGPLAAFDPERRSLGFRGQSGEPWAWHTSPTSVG